MKLFRIKTFGCKVNQYETQAIREALLSAGFQEAEDGQKADLGIVNTCTVTSKADKDSREALRRFIREDPDAEIIAAGCYVEADPEVITAIDKRIKVVGNKDKLGIAGIVRGRRPLLREDKQTTYDIRHTICEFKGHTKAFIKIQDGCNNFCSYCKVPHVRGRSKSRNPAEIEEEARQLIQNGYRELVLTGVCLGDFGKDLDGEAGLVQLVKRISDIEGGFRIRISSIELADVTDDLIDEMADSTKLCHHIHVPLQSGDDRVLKEMNRSYTVSEFIKRIEYIRSKISDIAITTDVIVGFPEEDELNFKNTLDAVDKIRPSRSHIFTYSPRKGTTAFDMKDNVSPGVKGRRFKELKELTDSLAEEFRQKAHHKRQRVLIENARDKRGGLLTGYTDTYIKVLVDGPDELMGRLISYPLDPSFLKVQS